MHTPDMHRKHAVHFDVLLYGPLLILFMIWMDVHAATRPIQGVHVSGESGVTAEVPWASATVTPTTAIWLPYIVGPSPARLLIAAAHIDSTISYEPDEAVLIWNVGGTAQSLAGWSLQANGRRVTFPITTTVTLEAGARVWCTAHANVFVHSFGEEADCEWAEDTDPSVPDLDGSMTLPNRGGSLQLLNHQDHVIDALLYGEVTQSSDGWIGQPAQAYTRGVIGATGQVWTRKQHPHTRLPLDTDQASDWIGDLADTNWGRQVRRPGWHGWDTADLGMPIEGNANATTTIAIGPEGLYTAIAGALESASAAIDMSIYTLEHPHLTVILTDALGRGVSVRILLEGSPPGGISDEQRWCVAQLAAAGADVRYMSTNDVAPNGYAPRYLYSHAKYLVVDSRLALVGTDNFNLDSMPLPSAEPIGGRRGYYVITDAAPVVAALQQVFDQDWRPDLFLDLTPYTPDHARYGDPPDDFVWPEAPLYAVDAAPFTEAVSARGSTHYTLVTAPENALHPNAGILALLNRAGAGDMVLVQQMYEHKYWGESTSNPIADANPRVTAIIAAARRGAHVRVLLDSFFDDGEELRSNRATMAYLRDVAAAENLDLQARLANPTGGGIHAKLLLLQIDGAQWSAVGSLNGGEISHKVNREVVLLTDAPAIHTQLQTVFAWDWALGQ